MKWNRIKHNWPSVSNEIKLTFGKLTEEDLAEIAGERVPFIGTLRQRYGYEQDEAETKVDAFVNGLSSKTEKIETSTWMHRFLPTLRNYINARSRDK